MIFIFKRPYWRVAVNCQAVKRMMHDNDFKDDDKIIDLSCTVCARWASGTDVVFGPIYSSVPSRSRCPEQRWPRPAAGSWGPGWSPWRWRCVASGLGRAVNPGRPRWCRISAPVGKNVRLIGSWISNSASPSLVLAPFMKCVPLPREGTWQRREAGLS